MNSNTYFQDGVNISGERWNKVIIPAVKSGVLVERGIKNQESMAMFDELFESALQDTDGKVYKVRGVRGAFRAVIVEVTLLKDEEVVTLKEKE